MLPVGALPCWPYSAVRCRHLAQRSAFGVCAKIPDSSRNRSAERLSELVSVEASDYFASGDGQWPLNQIRLPCHQLKCLLGREGLAFEVHCLKGWTLGIYIIARVNCPEQVFEFGLAERLLGIVPLVQFNGQFITQETSCVAAGGSGGFPKETCFLHMITKPKYRVQPALIACEQLPRRR
jgi:hypothetical protein